MNEATPEVSPEVSIVIRAYNEERWLPELFKALDVQTFRDFEVLVVDSGSLDRTRDIAAANKARIVLLRSEDFTFGYSLNIGIEQARGRFMAIISAHCIPTDPEWLGRLVAPLLRHRRAGVGELPLAIGEILRLVGQRLHRALHRRPLQHLRALLELLAQALLLFPEIPQRLLGILTGEVLRRLLELLHLLEHLGRERVAQHGLRFLKLLCKARVERPG
jgi:glycosyltransferase involved in cell wall biosynthesis